MNYILPLKINSKIKELVKNFVRINQKNDSFFVNNSGDLRNRQFYSTSYVDNDIIKSCGFDDKLIEERNRLFNNLEIFDILDEPSLGIFIGVNNEGGSVHEHMDACHMNSYDHVRINCLVSKPTYGGDPIIQNDKLQLEEDDVWLNVASRWKHSSIPVVGDKDRIVISFGALIHKEATDELIQKFKI
jgi:hypothetical protein